MNNEDTAAAHRKAFADRSGDIIDHARLWCRARDVPAEERLQAMKVLIGRLEDVVRVEVEL